MGRDLKGKELGPGVMQRKDGKYSATTMDTYVHMTDESLEEAMEIFSKNSTPIL